MRGRTYLLDLLKVLQQDLWHTIPGASQPRDNLIAQSSLDHEQRRKKTSNIAGMSDGYPSAEPFGSALFISRLQADGVNPSHSAVEMCSYLSAHGTGFILERTDHVPRINFLIKVHMNILQMFGCSGRIH